VNIGEQKGCNLTWLQTAGEGLAEGLRGVELVFQSVNRSLCTHTSDLEWNTCPSELESSVFYIETSRTPSISLDV
jgi:hypothetical protein